MCKKCVDAVKEFFPDAKESECGDILMCLTPFPFGKPEDVREALRVAAQNRANGTLVDDDDLKVAKRAPSAIAGAIEAQGIGEG
jgi:hypothetical protein